MTEEIIGIEIDHSEEMTEKVRGILVRGRRAVLCDTEPEKSEGALTFEQRRLIRTRMDFFESVNALAIGDGLIGAVGTAPTAPRGADRTEFMAFRPGIFVREMTPYHEKDPICRVSVLSSFAVAAARLRLRYNSEGYEDLLCSVAHIAYGEGRDEETSELARAYLAWIWVAFRKLKTEIRCDDCFDVAVPLAAHSALGSVASRFLTDPFWRESLVYHDTDEFIVRVGDEDPIDRWGPFSAIAGKFPLSITRFASGCTVVGKKKVAMFGSGRPADVKLMGMRVSSWKE